MKALYFIAEKQGDSPQMQIIVVKSGWNNPEQLYHILLEMGDDLKYQALLLNKKEMKEQLNLDFSDDDFLSSESEKPKSKLFLLPGTKT